MVLTYIVLKLTKQGWALFSDSIYHYFSCRNLGLLILIAFKVCWSNINALKLLMQSCC